MKKLNLSFAILFATLLLPSLWEGSGLGRNGSGLVAQNIVITDDDTYTANTSAMLDVKSLTKGMLVPRLTTTQRNAIATPATGLLVFDTSLNGFYYYNGSAWINLSSGSSSGLLWSYSSPYIYLTVSSDKVGIGTSTPLHKLHISDNVTITDGTDGSYIDIQNANANAESGMQSGIRFLNGISTSRFKGGIFYKDVLSFGRGDLIFANNSVAAIGNVSASDARLTIKNTGGIEVKATSGADANASLFHVLNATGDTIFAVYDGGVRINVYDDPLVKASGSKGGFAVGGFSPAKGTTTNEYLRITPDSIRMYVEDVPAAKASGSKGGFAVGGFSPAKAGLTNEYLRVTSDSTRIYTTDTISGFAAENISGSDKTSYLQLTPTNYFIGHQAGNSNTIGRFNSFIGYQSGFYNTTGKKNYFIGYKSGYNNITGFSNVFLGDSVGYSNTTGFKNIFLGNGTGMSNIDGNNNIFMGFRTGNKNTTGSFNIFIGDKSGYFNTIGAYNVFIGVRNGYNNISGNYNTSSGFEAMYNNTVGEFNTAIGFESLYRNDSGAYNTSVGYRTLKLNSTGTSNTAMGMYSLFANTIGTSNTGYGSYSLWQNTIGVSNTAIGSGSLYQNASGSNNTAVGDHALFNNISGNYLTAIGYNANVSADGLVNSTIIGNNANVNTSNKIRLGDANVTVIEGQVAYTFPSDGRFKNNVTEEVKGLDFITKLRPVVYNFDTKKFDEFLMKNMNDSLRETIIHEKDYSSSSSMRQTGFIAQEVEKAAKECGFDFNGLHKPENDNDNYSVAYSLFTVPLVKAVQELNAENNNLKLEIETLKTTNIQYQSQIEELKASIEKINNLLEISTKK